MIHANRFGPSNAALRHVTPGAYQAGSPPASHIRQPNPLAKTLLSVVSRRTRKIDVLAGQRNPAKAEQCRTSWPAGAKAATSNHARQNVRRKTPTQTHHKPTLFHSLSDLINLDLLIYSEHLSPSPLTPLGHRHTYIANELLRNEVPLLKSTAACLPPSLLLPKRSKKKNNHNIPNSPAPPIQRALGILLFSL